jgi:steroid delta-isomerase-like uncharacterized protein
MENAGDAQAVPSMRHIGRCIYCGSTASLSDEHIVPRGLNGPWLLLKGSCRECSAITSAFERKVLHEQFIVPRAALGLRTYHPKNRPKEFSFEVERDGHREKLVLPATDSPPIFMMLHLEKPRYVAEYPYEKGVIVKGASLHGPSLMDMKDRLRIEGITFNTTFTANCFEQLLAKVAYGMIVLVHGPDALETCYVLPCILGQKDDAGQWVGSSGNDPARMPREQALHRIRALYENFLAPNYVGHNLLTGDMNREQRIKNVGAAAPAMPDLSYSEEDMMAEGNKVVTRYTARGTHRGTFMGIPATGKQIVIRGVQINRLVDGKIAETWDFMDYLGLMTQLGVTPGAPPKK